MRKPFRQKNYKKSWKRLKILKRNLKKKRVIDRSFSDQLQKEAPSFCILPPKPPHVIGCRAHEVDEIIAQKLGELKKSSDNGLRYLYISGNPGSGKSQLAGLVAKRFWPSQRKAQCFFICDDVKCCNAKFTTRVIRFICSPGEMPRRFSYKNSRFRGWWH